MFVAMAWVDQRDVAKQHLSLADDALARVVADATVSRDVVDVLTELRAATVALAKLAGAEFSEDAPRTR